MSNLKEFINEEIDSDIVEEGVSPKTVISIFKKDMEQIEKTAKSLKTDYIRKLERRLMNDYISDDKKIKSIAEDIVGIKEALDDAISKLKSNVG